MASSFIWLLITSVLWVTSFLVPYRDTALTTTFRAPRPEFYIKSEQAKAARDILPSLGNSLHLVCCPSDPKASTGVASPRQSRPLGGPNLGFVSLPSSAPRSGSLPVKPTPYVFPAPCAALLDLRCHLLAQQLLRRLILSEGRRVAFGTVQVFMIS